MKGLQTILFGRPTVCTDLLSGLVVHLESPELESGGELANGGQREEELLCRAQRDVRVGQLGLLDLLLLLLSGNHGEDFLESTGRIRYKKRSYYVTVTN